MSQKKKTNTSVYLIGNAHLDPVWQWQWHEGYTEVKATFRSALDRMKEFPDYKFTSACAAYYEWVEESDPEMFREIQERVREGRWSITGGWYIQPDCNIPCGESFARHALISQLYFREKFGVMAKTGYNVDSFGHNGSIPKLLKQSKMDNYIFMRPEAHEKTLPSHYFLWQSADGSTVPTYRIHESYNIAFAQFCQPFDRCMDRFNKLADEAKEKGEANMAFYGIGNHGGGPTTVILENMREKLDDRFVYATVDEFFADTQDVAVNKPVVTDDLQFHAKGCYSANAGIKAGNRKSENMLLAAEKLSVLSGEVMGTAYPQQDLKKAWKDVLFNQFHDILGGCSLESAYIDAGRMHGEAQIIADRAINHACQQISWNIDTAQGIGKIYKWSASWMTDEKGTPLVVFNPHPWPIKTVVRYPSHPILVYDTDGNELPMQSVRAPRTDGSNTHEGAFIAEIPALGYALFNASRCDRKPYPSPFTVTENSMENDYIRIVFDKNTGELTSFWDKTTQQELLCGTTDALFMDESDSDTWAHGTVSFKKQAERPFGGSVRLMEEGPVLVTFRSERTIQGNDGVTRIRRDYTMTACSDVVTVKTCIDFHAHHRMLKFTFPVNAVQATALCDIPYGTIERSTDGAEQVCQKWFAVKDAQNAGLSVLNDSKYSFDVLDNTASLTVLRGCIFLDHGGNDHRDDMCEYQDQGIHKFTYALTPFRSITDTVKKAEELNQPPFRIMETFHHGSAPKKYAGIAVSADNIIVTAVKQSADDKATVIRAYECEDRDTDCTITLFGKTIQTHFGHSQVKTFRLEADGACTETDFLEE